MADYWLTPQAENDLETIWAYTANHYGVQQANRYLDAFDEAAKHHAKHPDQAASLAHVRSGYRRFLVGKHAAFFKTQNEGILIVRLLHQQMDALVHL